MHDDGAVGRRPGDRMRSFQGAPAVEAVLLDMDGTLIRSEHVHRAVWERFFAAWQVEMDDERYAEAVRGRRARTSSPSSPDPGGPRTSRRRWRR